MTGDDVRNYVLMLAPSQGFYGRLFEQVENEALPVSWDDLAESATADGADGMVGFVTWLEG